MKLVLLWFAALAAAAPVDDPLLRWMDAQVQQQLRERAAAVAEVRTVAQAERRKQEVRRRILEAIGGLPDYAGPLNARVTGRIDMDGYVIEKLIYQSLPGFYVTANLYRPTQPGRYPGVLLQSGHTQEGKAEPQALAANLALKGFVALAFDPIGQGEREQSWDPQLHSAAAGWSVNEHIHAGAQAALLNEGLARYFVFDAMRSLDYLVSRPDVDPDRIGAAGCSGGGALTTFTGALDPRIKAVIPACYPSSLQPVFAGAVAHSEMLVPGETARGLDTADFVELRAPVPWLLQATEQDFFPAAGVKQVYAEARRWYALYGAEDRIALQVGPGPHGMPPVSREAVYRWLIRWLKNGDGDPREQPVKLLANFELLVTRTGRVEDEPGSRKLHELLRDAFRARRQPGTAAGLEAELRRLRVPTDGSAPRVVVDRESEADGIRTQRLRFESEPGITCSATLLSPATPGRKPALLLVRGGRADKLAASLARQGTVVLLVEPRESLEPDDHRPYVGDWRSNTRADLMGASLAALRAHDLLRAVDLLAARDDVDPHRIRAAAAGVRGVWLLLAATADARLSRIWLDRTPWSLAQALDHTVVTQLLDATIPGFALHWDLADLVKAMAPRKVLWTDPANWMEAVVPLKGPYRYRWVLGDLTEATDKQDREFVAELLE